MSKVDDVSRGNAALPGATFTFGLWSRLTNAHVSVQIPSHQLDGLHLHRIRCERTLWERKVTSVGGGKNKVVAVADSRFVTADVANFLRLSGAVLNSRSHCGSKTSLFILCIVQVVS